MRLLPSIKGWFLPAHSKAGLLFAGGVGTGIAEALEWCAECGFQKPLVPQSGTAAGVFHQILVQHYHLLRVEDLQFAGSL
jgi:hypothetical protein